jgi:hypothetical protein
MTIILKTKLGHCIRPACYERTSQRTVIDTMKNKTGESNQIRSDGDVDIILFHYIYGQMINPRLYIRVQ